MDIDKGKRPVCVYHYNCLDGVGSAVLVERYFKGEVDLIAGEYGEEIDSSLFRDKEVYFVDFCYKREKMLEIKEEAKEIVVLDHHKTAHEEVGDVFNINQEHSGVMLTWLYFYPTETPPRWVELIEDRDLWKFNYPETRDFTAYAFLKGLEIEEVRNTVFNTELEEAIKLGSLLTERHLKQVNKLLESKRFMNVLGYEVPVFNSNSEYASDLGNLGSEGYPFAVIYVDTPKGRSFSLRSHSDGGVDVSVIAKTFGGGGHYHAAGFFIEYTDKAFANSHLSLECLDLDDCNEDW